MSDGLAANTASHLVEHAPGAYCSFAWEMARRGEEPAAAGGGKAGLGDGAELSLTGAQGSVDEELAAASRHVASRRAGAHGAYGRAGGWRRRPRLGERRRWRDGKLEGRRAGGCMLSRAGLRWA